MKLTLLYSMPPPAACKIQPTLARMPKTPATIWWREKEEMVLIRPAAPVAGRSAQWTLHRAKLTWDADGHVHREKKVESSEEEVDVYGRELLPEM